MKTSLKPSESNFSRNSRLLSSRKDESLKVEITKSVNSKGESFFSDRECPNFSNNAENKDSILKKGSTKGRKDSEDQREEESPIEVTKNGLQRNLIRLQNEDSDPELSPITKESHSNFPFIQKNSLHFKPLGAKVSTKQSDCRFSLKPDLNKKRILTRLSDSRPFSPENPRKQSFLNTYDEYSHFPKIERNLSESSRIKRCSRFSEKSYEPYKSSRLLVNQHERRLNTVYGDQGSTSNDSPSTKRLQIGRLRIGEFDKRIQRMKLELASMRRACQ